MDYSLLLGIYYPTEKNKAKTEANIKKRKEGGTYISSLKQNAFQEHLKAVREDGVEEIYYIGIIDILIEYAAKKKVEHLLKWIAYAGEEVSVVEPEFYKQRFDKFIKELVYLPQSDKTDKKESSESEDISSETGEGDKIDRTMSTPTVSVLSISTPNNATNNVVSTSSSLGNVPKMNEEGVKLSAAVTMITKATKVDDSKTTRRVASPPSKDTVTVNKKQKN